MSMVLDVTYRVRNLVLVLPRSYTPVEAGRIDPATIVVLPTYKLPPMPTPPVTVKAPEVVDVAVILPVTDNCVVAVTVLATRLQELVAVL